ncbi:MAG: TIGR04211 family SH3 domain-containing protein [Thermodesulforhabdaceae bacterium]
MRKLDQTLALVWLFLVFSLIYSGNALGADSYVTDRVDIQFRTGPGTSHKLIGTLTPGISVEVKKEQGGWCLVVPKEGPFSGKEGWVHKRHITSSPPSTKDVVQLTEENKSLKTTITQYENEVASLKQTIASMEKALEESKAQYTKLQTEAADFLSLKQTHDSLQKNIASLKEERDKLQEESRRAKNSERIKWFLTGAGVLFCGWVIGMIMGRLQRRRNYISYWR